MAYYINFYFKELEYTEDFYTGIFSAPDYDVYCEFLYDRKNDTIDIWNNNKPVDEILPIPVYWLDRRLEENGILRENENKISY